MSTDNSKHLWIEASNTPDKMWIDLFSDCGIPNTHTILTSVHSIPKKDFFDKIDACEQICFFSSMVAGSDSLILIEGLLSYFLNRKITGKKVISGGYLLEPNN